MVVPAGDQTTTSLALAGAYRPQPGPAGAALDRAIVRRFAAAAGGGGSGGGGGKGAGEDGGKREEGRGGWRDFRSVRADE